MELYPRSRFYYSRISKIQFPNSTFPNKNEELNKLVRGTLRTNFNNMFY